jgi:hypothetical protein
VGLLDLGEDFPQSVDQMFVSVPQQGGGVGVDDLKRAVLVYGVNAYYDRLSGQTGKLVSGHYLYKCWHHSDQSTPNMTVYKDGGYHCFACGAQGDAISAYQHLMATDFKDALKEIANLTGVGRYSGVTVEEAQKILSAQKDPRPEPGEIPADELMRLAVSQEALQSNAAALARLADNYGVSADAARRYGLGWDSRRRRLAIPIKNADGRVANIKFHDILRIHCAYLREGGMPFKVPPGKPTWNPDACKQVGKLGFKSHGIKGHNRGLVYPSIGDVVGQSICITGGELKAVLLRELGIPAVSFITGENGFEKSLLHSFAGMEVDICLDADDAGVRAAKRLGDEIAKHAGTVRIVKLPAGDVTDHYRERKWDASDWASLEREVVSSDGAFYEKIKFDGVHDVSKVGKRVEVLATIVGGNSTARAVASSVTATCDEGRNSPIELCDTCRLCERGFTSTASYNEEQLLAASYLPSGKQAEVLIGFIGAPKECPNPKYEITNTRMIPMAVSPVIDSVDGENERYFVHPVQFTGSTIPPMNKHVRLRGVVRPDPKSSFMMLMGHDAVEVTNRAKSELTQATHDWLHAGDPLTRMVDDLTSVTGITGQPNMMIAFILLHFMPVVFRMDGRENGKRTAEVAIIGDARQGKSTAMKRMMEHYGVGTTIDCEGATHAGLIGGMADFGGSVGKMFAWGPIPLNDGGLIFLDEFDALVKKGIFDELTSVRSSGVASRIVAGINHQANARVRMAWACNPTNYRDLSSYDSTLACLREIVPAPQDIARFEFVIGIHRNKNPTFLKERPVSYTKPIAANHVRWAWAQQIDIVGDALRRADELGEFLATKYRGLPTLPQTEARWKVGRLAAAFAMINGRTEVIPSDVDFAASYLDLIYEDGKVSLTIRSPVEDHGDAVKSAVLALGGDVFAKRMLRPGVKGISGRDLERMRNVAAMTSGDALKWMSLDKLVHILIDVTGVLREKRGTLYPTDEFLDYLRGTEWS